MYINTKLTINLEVPSIRNISRLITVKHDMLLARLNVFVFGMSIKLLMFMPKSWHTLKRFCDN